MRTKIQNIAKISVILIFAIITTSCNDEEINMPEILDFELGYENSKTVHAGNSLHIDSEIIAENGIDVIEIGIHYEGVHKKSIRIAIGDDHIEWEVGITFDKFRGLKNTTFHEDLDVPLNAEPGEYHFHFKVIDMEGYTAEIEKELMVLEPATD